jgi:hypothetical protein
MPISFPFSNKAELRVDVGKTSVEELQKFQEQATAKGGGDLRAKKNSDGSHTLYVSADTKVTMRGVFGKSYGSEARTAKLDLAKDLVKEIISRRIPAGKNETGVSASTKALMSRIDKSNHSITLGGVLQGVANDAANDLKKERHNVGKERYGKLDAATREQLCGRYGNLDTMLATPSLRKVFGEAMNARRCEENFDFLCKANDYHQTTNPHEKLKLAEELIKMIDAPGSTQGGFSFEGEVSINISSVLAREIHGEMAYLRSAIEPGKEPSPSDQARLDRLFEGAEIKIGSLTRDNIVNTFVKSDAFQAELGNLAAASDMAENTPSSLEVGSGKEYLDRVKQGKEHFSTLENILDDPEVSTAFREHLEANGKTEMLDQHEQMNQLALLADDPHISDEDLLKAAEDLLLPQGVDTPPARNELSLDDGDGATPMDSHQQKISDKLAQIKENLNEARKLAGDDPESRMGQEQIFGLSETPPKSLAHNQIKDFIISMKASAVNGLRTNGFNGFKDGVLAGMIEKRVGGAMNNEQREQIEWNPDKEQHFGSWDRFDGQKLQGAGGATGSGSGKVGKQLYQVKGSIAHAGLGRRLKAGGLNTENYGEVIASNISRAMVGASDRRLIPEVSLRQNQAKHEAMVTSRYLTGGTGDLKAKYISEAGPLPKDQKHPKIHLNEVGKSGGGVLRLQGQAAKDVQRNIALSALMGDHDVNPGNMIMTKDGRVGRIDFGHAFNELISGPGGKATGGGGVRNKSNRILDFFNRETVSGVPFTGQTKSKLWRDYTGAGPSEGMTDALRTMASSTEAGDGIAQAKTQFADLIVALEAEGTPEAQEQIEDLTKSLIRMSRNIEKPITSTDPGAVVKEVFDNLAAFVTEGQDQMREVADLSDLQTKIDAYVTSTRENPDAPVPPEITQLYQDLSAKSVKSPDGEGLCWMKMSAGSPAFQGNIESYVQTRRDALTAQI